MLRVFAQEIVPRPDSGSAFVCKSHVRLCVASPVPVSFMLITSARKLPVEGRCSLKTKILHARSLPVGQSCCSVAIWGAQGLEKCRFSDTKIGAARRPQFWGRSSSLFMYLHIIIREAGCISWPHFWGRETAPFLGSQV